MTDTVAAMDATKAEAFGDADARDPEQRLGGADDQHRPSGRPLRHDGRFAVGDPDEIAEAAGLDERYVREWLGAMVTAGIVEYDTGRGGFRAATRARRA